VAISYNTGATGGTDTSASTTVTIPAGVLASDVMIMSLEVFTEVSSAPTIAFSGAGGTWTQIGSTQVATAGSSVWSYGYAYYRVATAGDPGQVLTITETGSPGATTWLSVAIAAYTGASTVTPIDVNGAAVLQGAQTITLASETTGVSGDWAVYLWGGGVPSGTTMTGPAGSTQRQNRIGAALIGGGIWDSNGSVGAAGTSIGGGTFHGSIATGGYWLEGFTLGLAPAGVPASPESPVPPNLAMLPLWEEILADSAYRRDVAPVSATVAPFTWRLMDGAAGRPGVASSGTQPPASATANAGNLVNGTSFYVTQGGMWFQGYWYYCCASGQSTSPVKCALWSCFSGGGSVVPGSAVTSGTLAAGAWNWIPLPNPVQIAIWGQYTAAVGVPASAGFPDTAAQFGAAQPYAAGIVNGPVAAFSDAAGSNPAPYSYGQGATSSGGADPAVTQPSSGSGTHDNWWLDVQVANTPPANYAGSYRLWPNMADGDSSTAVDSAVNYVVGTEIITSQPSVINRIWYYMPPGTAQFATSADIWRVRDGVRVATQPSPVWRQASGARATITSGQGGTSAQWVWCELPGTVTIPAGDWRVSIYNGNGSPDGWSAKRLYYWEQGNTPGNTYLTGAPGQAGITAGPVYAPPTPLASPATDYSTGLPEPGQSVFAVGPPNQFPNVYVGASPSGIYSGPALFQNYWVDVEVTPAALFQPDQPLLPPRIPHPQFFQLLEEAAYRQLSTAVSAQPTASANAGAATATGAAPAPSVAITAAAGLPTGTGASQAPTVALTVSAGLATGTAAAQSPAAAITVNAGLATGTGAALQPSVSTSGSTNANAGAATATGTAQAPAPALTVLAALATGTGTAPAPGGGFTPRLATATAAAQAPALSLTALAQASAGLGAALAARGTAAALFTVGKLTATTAAGGAGGTLTASTQRTGGPA
jgi:hypothetical protein